MEADGVTDNALDTLVRNIAKVIAHRRRLQTELARPEALAGGLKARTT
jgi:hypothetical protein